MDPQEQNRQRMNNALERNIQVNENLIQTITKIMQNSNLFGQQYRHLYHHFVQQENQIPNVYIELIGQRRNPHNREFDLPVVQEVAAIVNINNANTRIPKLRVCLSDNQQFRDIDYQSEVCNPLCFPLLFPNGEPGWRYSFFPLIRQPGRRQTFATLDQFISIFWLIVMIQIILNNFIFLGIRLNYFKSLLFVLILRLKLIVLNF